MSETEQSSGVLAGAAEAQPEGESPEPQSKEEQQEKKKGGPRAKGLTNDIFDGYGIRTLEAWAKFWSNKEAYEKDGFDEARANHDLPMIEAEIKARRDDMEAKKQAREAAEAQKAEEAAKAPEPETANA